MGLQVSTPCKFNDKQNDYYLIDQDGNIAYCNLPNQSRTSIFLLESPHLAPAPALSPSCKFGSSCKPPASAGMCHIGDSAKNIKCEAQVYDDINIPIVMDETLSGVLEDPNIKIHNSNK